MVKYDVPKLSAHLQVRLTDKRPSGSSLQLCRLVIIQGSVGIRVLSIYCISTDMGNIYEYQGGIAVTAVTTATIVTIASIVTTTATTTATAFPSFTPGRGIYCAFRSSLPPFGFIFYPTNKAKPRLTVGLGCSGFGV